MLLYLPRSVRSLDSNLDLITLYSFQPPISLPPSLSSSILYTSAITMPLVSFLALLPSPHHSHDLEWPCSFSFFVRFLFCRIANLFFGSMMLNSLPTKKTKTIKTDDNPCHICIIQSKLIIGRRIRRTISWVSQIVPCSHTVDSTHYWFPDVPGPGVRGEKEGDVGE